MSDTHKYVVYKAKDGWRWYEVSSSDETSESGEAYTHKQDAYEQAVAHAGDGVEVEVQDKSTHAWPPTTKEKGSAA